MISVRCAETGFSLRRLPDKSATILVASPPYYVPVQYSVCGIVREKFYLDRWIGLHFDMYPLKIVQFYPPKELQNPPLTHQFAKSCSCEPLLGCQLERLRPKIL